MGRTCGIAVVLACLALARPLAAQSDRAAAEVLFQEARKSIRKGDWASACPKLAESHRLDPAPGTLLNLAECEAKIGKLASAWQRFDELVQTLKPNDPRVRVAKRRAAELAEILPRLTIRLASSSVAADGVRIKLDGVELSTASLGVPLPADPGAHAVVVSAPGRVDKSYEVELGAGKSREIEVELGAKDEPEPAAEPTPAAPARKVATPKRDEAGSNSAAFGWVVGGIGVAALATSAVAGVIALDRKATVEDECSGEFCTDEGLDAADSGNTWSNVATVSFAAGVVLTGVGAWIVLSSSGDERAALGVQSDARGARVSVRARF